MRANQRGDMRDRENSNDDRLYENRRQPMDRQMDSDNENGRERRDGEYSPHGTKRGGRHIKFEPKDDK